MAMFRREVQAPEFRVCLIEIQDGRRHGISQRTHSEDDFGEVAFERTSFTKREGGKEWVGTMANLWGITAGVYLALLGPQGMVEIGQDIMSRARYAMMELDKVKGVKAPGFQSFHFKEFVVNFRRGGK